MRRFFSIIQNSIALESVGDPSDRADRFFKALELKQLMHQSLIQRDFSEATLKLV
ncbi:hypothetical protein Ple7327_4167 [Pleurocapsa sp. PCC 7327]|nr:hypothetical protein Ple7327_4167 [Pleurocapsa sp. PCC 7327]